MIQQLQFPAMETARQPSTKAVEWVARIPVKDWMQQPLTDRVEALRHPDRVRIEHRDEHVVVHGSGEQPPVVSPWAVPA